MTPQCENLYINSSSWERIPRPIPELELVRFRQPLRVGKIRGLSETVRKKITALFGD